MTLFSHLADSSRNKSVLSMAKYLSKIMVCWYAIIVCRLLYAILWEWYHWLTAYTAIFITFSKSKIDEYYPQQEQ
jgi:hypothetical protein